MRRARLHKFMIDLWIMSSFLTFLALHIEYVIFYSHGLFCNLLYKFTLLLLPDPHLQINSMSNPHSSNYSELEAKVEHWPNQRIVMERITALKSSDPTIVASISFVPNQGKEIKMSADDMNYKIEVLENQIKQMKKADATKSSPQAFAKILWPQCSIWILFGWDRTWYEQLLAIEEEGPGTHK